MVICHSNVLVLAICMYPEQLCMQYYFLCGFRKAYIIGWWDLPCFFFVSLFLLSLKAPRSTDLLRSIVGSNGSIFVLVSQCTNLNTKSLKLGGQVSHWHHRMTLELEWGRSFQGKHYPHLLLLLPHHYNLFQIAKHNSFPGKWVLAGKQQKQKKLAHTVRGQT